MYGNWKRQRCTKEMQVRVIEREHGGYEVREVPHGKVYSWNPGRLRVECEYGEVLDREESEVASGICECGAKCEESLGGLDSLEENSLEESSGRPWVGDYKEWREEKEAKGVRCEYYAFVEVDNDS
jgi:hypothetical protein